MKTPSRQTTHDLANLQAAVNALTVRVTQLEQQQVVLEARVVTLEGVHRWPVGMVPAVQPSVPFQPEGPHSPRWPLVPDINIVTCGG